MLKLSKMGALVLAITGLGAAHAATVNATIAGWNLLGYSDTADVVVSDAFGEKAKVTTVWKWTGAGWAFYSPDLSDGGQAYAASKGYDFLTTIKSGDGFWVNAKQTFSATLPAPAAPVNAAALTGITATMKTFQEQFATAIPTSTTALAPLVDDTFLMNGINKATFLQAMLEPGEGPSVGGTFVNIALVNPLDAGSVPNDATHQWFTFSDSTGGGPGSAWLAIKNVSGNWLIAGDWRMFDFYTSVQAVKHTSAGGTPSYNNQIEVSVENLPAAVTQVVLTGPGVIPSTGLTIYTAGVGRIWSPPCGVYNNTTNCIDPAAASAGAQYTIRTYGGVTGTPIHTYTNGLPNAPVNPTLLPGLSYPTISSTAGSWASGGSVTVNWLAAANTFGDWLDIGAWSMNATLFNNVGVDLTGSTGAATTLTVPTYSGTYSGRNVWLSVRDASGNRLALDYQL